MANTLSPRQEKFCEEYVRSGSAQGAAIAAGYSQTSAHKASSWIKFDHKRPQLFRPCVAARISELMQEQRENSRLTRERLQELRERIILGEEQDISVSVRGDVIAHTPDLSVRLKAMAAWENALDNDDKRKQANAQAERNGIKIEVPEDYMV